jgi:hypothetical protein
MITEFCCLIDSVDFGNLIEIYIYKRAECVGTLVISIPSFVLNGFHRVCDFSRVPVTLTFYIHILKKLQVPKIQSRMDRSKQKSLIYHLAL